MKSLTALAVGATSIAILVATPLAADASSVTSMTGSQTCSGTGNHIGVRGENNTLGSLKLYLPSGTLVKSWPNAYSGSYTSSYYNSTKTWKVTSGTSLDTGSTGGTCVPPT